MMGIKKIVLIIFLNIAESTYEKRENRRAVCQASKLKTIRVTWLFCSAKAARWFS
jgi:hypothetical protein